MDISYVIREKNDKNIAISEAKTHCPFEAIAELLLKTRLKNMLGGRPSVYILHKKNAYQHAAMFITIHYQFQYRRDIFIELETIREKLSSIEWSSCTDPMYLEDGYLRKVALFVSKIKKFTSNRSLVLPVLVTFAVKNNNHLFWKDLLGADRLDPKDLKVDFVKPFKR